MLKRMPSRLFFMVGVLLCCTRIETSELPKLPEELQKEIIEYVPFFGKGEDIASTAFVSKRWRTTTKISVREAIIKEAIRQDLCKKKYLPEMTEDRVKKICQIASNKFDISSDQCNKLMMEDINDIKSSYFRWYTEYFKHFSPFLLEQQVKQPEKTENMNFSEQIIQDIENAWDRTITLSNPVNKEQKSEYRYIVYEGGVIADMVTLLTYEKSVIFTKFTVDNLMQYAEIVKAVKENPSVMIYDQNGNSIWFYKNINNIFSDDILKQFEGNINKRNMQDKTALFENILEGNVEYITLLLKYGASVNITDCKGQTPLVSTVLQYLYNVENYSNNNKLQELEEVILAKVQLLLEHGAIVDFLGVRANNPFDVGHLKTSLLHEAFMLVRDTFKIDRNEKKFPKEIDAILRIVTLLIRYGADPDKGPLNFSLQYALDLSLFWKENRFIELLLSVYEKRDHNLTSKNFRNAFLRATKSGKTEIIDMFLPAIKNINEQDSQGNTILHTAFVNFIEYLKELKSLNGRKRSPVEIEDVERDYEQIKKYLDVISFLLDKNADPDIENRLGKAVFEFFKTCKTLLEEVNKKYHAFVLFYELDVEKNIQNELKKLEKKLQSKFLKQSEESGKEITKDKRKTWVRNLVLGGIGLSTLTFLLYILKKRGMIRVPRLALPRFGK